MNNLEQGTINKLNDMLSQIGEVRDELAKVNNLKKRLRLLEKGVKNLLMENECDFFENSEWLVTIERSIKDKITEEKVIEIIELFDTNQLDSLCLEDFFVPKESVSMKIKKVNKEEE